MKIHLQEELSSALDTQVGQGRFVVQCLPFGFKSKPKKSKVCLLDCFLKIVIVLKIVKI